MPTYRYNADHIAQARGKYNPQKKNAGMLELYIDGLAPGGQEILMLSLQSVSIPGYSVGRGEITYLNGTVFFPTKPEGLGEMTTNFRDYHDTGTRYILERLHERVYDPRTGQMGLPKDIKVQGTLILLREDDSDGRTYYLDGCFPLNKPAMNVDFGDGEQEIMEIRWSVDSIIGRRA
jgi:hypothetical protein